MSSAWSASGRGLGILTSNEVSACVGGQKVPGEVKKGNEVVGSGMKFLIGGVNGKLINGEINQERFADEKIESEGYLLFQSNT